MTVSVMLNLPDDVYFALAGIADGKDTQVHRMLEAALTRQVCTPPKKGWRKFSDAEVARVRELNAEGWSDSRIAKELGRNQASVSEHRRSMGLESPTPRHPGAGRQKRVA